MLVSRGETHRRKTMLYAVKTSYVDDYEHHHTRWSKWYPTVSEAWHDAHSFEEKHEEIIESKNELYHKEG